MILNTFIVDAIKRLEFDLDQGMGVGSKRMYLD